MAKRRRRSRGGGGCCPRNIVLKCKLKRSQPAPSSGPSLAERLAKFKEAERKEWARLGAYTPRGFFPNPPNRGKRAAAAARAARHAGMCTVKFGGHTIRANPAKAAAIIRGIMNKQRAKGCMPPTLSRG